MKGPFISVASLLAVLSGPASAAFSADGFITVANHVGSDWTYDIHIDNTGSESIGTLWYSWIPTQGYLDPMPTGPFANPSGFGAALVTDGPLPTNGFSVRWVATGTGIDPGASLDGFEFTTTETPDELSGLSNIHPGVPVGTSVLYQGAPFQGDSATIVINPTPEPGSLAAVGLGGLWLFKRRRKS